jgi:hypothetical protein
MTGITIEGKIQFNSGPHGQKRIKERPVQEAPEPTEGRTPRVARIMALAIKLETLIAQGHVRGFADISRLGHVTRARVTQIMNLLMLAPDIQEAILFLPPITRGRDTLIERDLRKIAAVPDWGKQRQMWEQQSTRILK